MSGFRFERVRREFSEINSASAEQIYGDKFTKGEDEVTGIGNNVVLDFGEFDFTDGRPSKLVICGRSPLPLNSIHLTAGTERILCEFRTEGESGYVEREFPLALQVSRTSVLHSFPAAILISDRSDLKSKKKFK